MPDYKFDTDLTVKPQNQMSLGDIVGLAKGSYELSKMKELYPSIIAEQQAKSESAQTASKKATLGLRSDFANIMRNNQIALINNPLVVRAEQDPEFAKAHAAELHDLVTGQKQAAIDSGLDPDKAEQLNAPYHVAVDSSGGQGLRQFLKTRLMAGLDSEGQARVGAPTGIAVSTGAQGRTVATNPFGATPQGETLPGTAYTNQLAPQVFTSPYSGGATIIGGVGGQNVNQPTNAPSGGATSGITNQFNQKTTQGGVLQPLPGEVPEAYRARTADVMNVAKNAQSALDAGNPGSVVNMQTTNKKIEQLLDKPDLNIGPVANAIKNKTGGVGLTTDQQVVYKYLEQRVLQTGAGSDAQRDAQRTAFGSFANDKDALRTILAKDGGVLKGQELLSRGALNYQGNANNPNLQAINNFKNEFTKLADPETLHLIGVIGENPNIRLTDSQKSHLKSEFGNMPRDEFNALLAKRKAILNLVNGNQ